MKENTCPICGKNGIPDFQSQDVVCPCCGSNLSIYRLVNQIKAESQSQTKIESKSVRIVTCSLIAAIAVLLLVSSIFVINTMSYKERLAASEGAYAALVIENQDLKDSISEIERATSQSSESVMFKYIVRKGDSFWSISRKIYGTGTKYKEIADYNNLEVTATLKVGDVLIIK